MSHPVEFLSPSSVWAGLSTPTPAAVLMSFKIQRGFKKVHELDSSGLFVKMTVNSKDLFHFSHPEVMIRALVLYLVYCYASGKIFCFEVTGTSDNNKSQDLH